MEKSLFKACEEGDLQKVISLVETEKVDVELIDCYGDTPLIIASREGHLDIVKYLVENVSANIDFTNRYKHYSLIIATWNGNRDIIKYLVENGANIENKYGLLNDEEENEIREIIKDIENRRRMVKPCPRQGNQR